MTFIEEFESYTRDKAENYIGNHVINLCNAGDLKPDVKVLIANKETLALVDIARLSLKASLKGGVLNV